MYQHDHFFWLIDVLHFVRFCWTWFSSGDIIDTDEKSRTILRESQRIKRWGDRSKVRRKRTKEVKMVAKDDVAWSLFGDEGEESSSSESEESVLIE